MIPEKDASIDQHSAGKSIILHLLPGILIGSCYFLLTGFFARLGYPSIMGLMVSVMLVLVPFELGYLLYQGYKRNNKISLGGILSYDKKVPW